MKKYILVLLIAASFITLAMVRDCRAEDGSVERETVSIGGINNKVYKGIKINTNGQVTSIESTKQYTVRRLQEAEANITILTAKEQRLEDEVRELKAKLLKESQDRKALEDRVKRLEEVVNELSGNKGEKK